MEKIETTFRILALIAAMLIATIGVSTSHQKAIAVPPGVMGPPSSAAVTGAGSTGQGGSNIGGVDRNLFCNTGIITPICK